MKAHFKNPAREALEDLIHEAGLAHHSQRPRAYTGRAAVGMAELGWYRGQQTGQFEGYQWLAENHPRIAEKYRKEFNLTTDGSKIL